jgi:hypothetical protein
VPLPADIVSPQPDRRHNPNATLNNLLIAAPHLRNSWQSNERVLLVYLSCQVGTQILTSSRWEQRKTPKGSPAAMFAPFLGSAQSLPDQATLNALFP